MDFVSDGLNQGSSLAVDPDTVATGTPTPGPKCGTPGGVAAHWRRKERSCQDCLDAANQARTEWMITQGEKEDRERAERSALLRPSMAFILEAHGVRQPEIVIAALDAHGYGDQADALLQASKECPIGVNISTDGGSIRTWLYGRAMLIRKEL